MPGKHASAIPRAELVSLYRKALASGVELDQFESKISTIVARMSVTETIEAEDEEEREETIKRRLPKAIRYGAFVLPIVFISAGLFLVGNAVVPILGYYVSTLPGLRSSSLTAPIPPEQVLDVNPIVIAHANSISGERGPAFEPTIIDTELDYTNLSNWFDDTDQSSLQATTEEVYVLDIPKLNIQNAEVKVGGTDLDDSLIQYPGTALPGDPGAPVIFGHSVLRQFYNPSEKNPRRYNSIFSTIMTLKPGDEIFVTNDGVKYTYVVQDKIEVKPEDTYILNQKYDGRQLKLVTCTPEGTYLRRGVVIAQLVRN